MTQRRDWQRRDTLRSGRPGVSAGGRACASVTRWHDMAEEDRLIPGGSAEAFVLSRIGPDDAGLSEAVALGDADRRYLGLLTPEAYRDYAAAGALLGASDSDGRLLAYAAYRLPRDEVVLAHLVVSRHGRGRGLARALVDKISADHAARRGVKARCRRDFPAHAMWAALGFVALGDSPGRGRDGALLTTWWRDHGHEDLLSWTGGTAERLAVALDTNVFLDLHATAGRVESTRDIIDMLADRVEPLVTPELHNEIDRRAASGERSALHAAASAYPSLTAPHDRVAALEAALLVPATPGRQPRQSDRSDARHVAWAAAAGVGVLVTRDERALARLGAPAHDIGVRLVTPQDLVALVDEAEDAPSYRPEALLGTGYTLREVGDDDRSDLQAFLSTAGGERARDLRRTLRRLAAERPAARRLLVSDPDGRPVALIGARPAQGTLEVPLLRLQARALRATLAAQALAVVRTLASEAGTPVIRLADPHADAEVAEAAIADGFGRAADGVLTAVRLAGRRTARAAAAELRALTAHDSGAASALAPLASTLDRLAHDPDQPALAAAVEHRMRPLTIVDVGLPCFLVPIKPAWSSQLFGAPAQLYERPGGLGLSLEHVYYRSTRPAREAAPARVLWYASGGGPLGSHAIAVSQLTGVDLGPAAEVWRRYQRLGAYRRSDVERTADASGNVRALRLADTRLLSAPVPYRTLVGLAERFGQKLTVRSPLRISGELFAAVLEEARDG